MNLRNDSDADSNHRFNACRFLKVTMYLRNKFLMNYRKRSTRCSHTLGVHPFGDSYSGGNVIDSDDDAKCKKLQ